VSISIKFLPWFPPLTPAAGTCAGGLILGVMFMTPHPVLAQRVVPKIGTICPMGYVDTLNGKCSTLGLMTYTVQPTNGKPCLEGWMNVGGGYCRKK
jgi:hypothetical protein